MPRYGSEAPHTADCAVCLEVRRGYQFHPMPAPNGAPGAWRWNDVCRDCTERAHKGTRTGGLTADQMERLVAVRAQRRVQQAYQPRIKGAPPPKPAPVEVEDPSGRTGAHAVVALAMEQELGIPEHQWSRPQNMECTRRIYRHLGWDEADLLRDSAAAARARAQRQREMAAAGRRTQDDEEGDDDDA